MEFYHEDYDLIPNNMFPPLTSLSADNNDLIIKWQATTANGAEIKDYKVMILNNSAQWAFPPDEQCLWEDNWLNEDG